MKWPIVLVGVSYMNSKLISSALFIAVLPAMCHVAMGAIGKTTGREWGRWTEDKYSVIVAHVHEVKPPEGEGYLPHAATLKPRATLAGTLDPSVHVFLPVRFFASSMTSSISEPPRENDLILAVVRVGVPQGEEQEISNWIVSNICTFMPNASAIAKVKGMDDPLVLETLEKLQAARANPHPNPYGTRTRPATRPATP